MAEAELRIYRGLPASGKTTHARSWVNTDPVGRARVNRDDLRRMLHDGYVDGPTEQLVRVARDRLVKSLLDQGVSVACDDTNLSARVARSLARIGRYAGATVRVVDLTDVPLELCILRDQERAHRVGADVIQGMHDRYLAGRDLPLPSIVDDPVVTSPGAYAPRPGTPRAVMVDLDGTLCLHDGRSPYDETLVHTDVPNPAVVAAIRALDAAGYRILFVSGRSAACMQATLDWILEHVGALDGLEALVMRPVGDKRRDAIVKVELFDRYVRDQYDVAFVLDDRDQVVRAWREIGLAVFQVADGAF